MKNIFIFGDSIVHGVYDTEAGGWATRLTTYFYQRAIDAGFSNRCFVYNLGIPSEDILGIQERVQSEIVAREDVGQKELVIFADGINDSRINVADGKSLVDLSAFTASYKSVVQGVLTADRPVVLVGLTPVDESRMDPVPWRPDSAYRNARIKEYDDSVKTIAADHQALYIPMWDLFENRSELLTDGLHPNSEGHTLIFERVREYLEKAGIN